MEKQSHKKVSSGQGLSDRSAVRAGKSETHPQGQPIACLEID
jgi:hypothetical protein